MSRLAPETHLLPAPQRTATERAPRGLRAVVLGGGIGGLAAATILCERGVRVTLLEREAQLGGRAASFDYTLQNGQTLQMERGFHGFFRQYYNLRALLERVDPGLRRLSPLSDYPILGPDGLMQSFTNLPPQPPFSLLKLVWQTPYLSAGDLLKVDKRRAMAMLRYDPEGTYARFDGTSAADYLDSLAFPPRARRMLFDVFAHSFFNPETEMSAGELLMMFHFYFTANPEGLIFDVANRPLSAALWTPLGDYLEQRGADVRTGVSAQRVERGDDGRFRVSHDGGESEADLLVLALDVAGLQRLVAHSPGLQDPVFAQAVGSLERTNPFGVLRLWLDRPVDTSRAAFAGTTGVGQLDNISVYERFQDESHAWAQAQGGSVVELHAYAVPEGMGEAELREDLMRGLHTFYPETRQANVVDSCMLLREDCPGFAPGSHARRPTPQTPYPNLALAGDFVRMPFPCGLMERATASGFLAANLLLSPHGVAPEPLRSVPTRGLFSPPRWPRRGAERRAVHASA